MTIISYSVFIELSNIMCLQYVYFHYADFITRETGFNPTGEF